MATQPLQPKTSVEIPLKDSAENDFFVRHLNDYCIDVWNMTQRWDQLNGQCYGNVESLANARLSIKYARSTPAHMTGHAQAANKLLCDSDVNTNALLPVGRDDRRRVQRKIIDESEELSVMVDRHLTALVNKFASAADRLGPLKQLLELSPEIGCSAQIKVKLDELHKMLPMIAKMYRKELAVKRAALRDLSTFNSSSVFLAILAAWSRQPFIDRALLCRLYALVV